MQRILTSFLIGISLCTAQLSTAMNLASYRAKLSTLVAPLQGTASKIGSACNQFYQAESVRTAILRSAMACYALSDGVCSLPDLTLIGLAAASVTTALSYSATAAERCAFLPAKYNLVADGIALIASCDAGALSITGSTAEELLRSAISAMSMFATGMGFLG